MEWIPFALVLGVIPGAIAQSKGRNFVGWWLYGAALFFVALPHSLIASNLKEQREREAGELAKKAQERSEEQRKTQDQLLSKICPMCAESVKRAAKVCRFCGHTFAETTEVGSPQVDLDWLAFLESLNTSATDELGGISTEDFRRLADGLTRSGIVLKREPTRYAITDSGGSVHWAYSDRDLVRECVSIADARATGKRS
jgi:hypothetical protein